MTLLKEKVSKTHLNAFYHIFCHLDLKHATPLATLALFTTLALLATVAILALLATLALLPTVATLAMLHFISF